MWKSFRPWLQEEIPGASQQEVVWVGAATKALVSFREKEMTTYTNMCVTCHVNVFASLSFCQNVVKLSS